ncbi:MAG TPA: class I SAM-dependent methyltransferase [Ilumatobacter sp.]
MDESDDGWLLRGSADRAEVAAYYDAWAERYDADLDAWAYRAPAVVAERVLAGRPATVLDAGCGTGGCGRALRRLGFSGTLTGVDVSEASIALAAASGAYSSLATADLQRPLDFAADTFDALTCVGVMTYLPDVDACWREFCRVVRPGGVVAFTQREDLWEPRACRVVIDRLAADGVWSPTWVSDPQPYLPGNEAYADRIGVHYVVASVRS